MTIIKIDASEVMKLAEAKFGSQALGAVKHATGAALVMECEAVRTDAMEHYIPVVSGTLKGTTHVKGPYFLNQVVQCEVAVGGPAAPYALIVHERPKSVGQGKNKYLSQPLNAAKAGMAERIMARVIQRALGW